MMPLSDSDNLTVTLVQTALEWHKPFENRQNLAKKLHTMRYRTDLVVLPEMFTSGFTVHPENVGGQAQTLDWMKEQAQKLDAAITGSVAWELPDHQKKDNQPIFTNRLLFVQPDGQYYHYDKVHLFRMAGEHKRYQAGQQRHIIRYKGWRLFLSICYDLRFPVFCRNCNDYELMLCVANWPEARRHHWRTLLQARAIENQAYVVGVNRVGVDGTGLQYQGDSLAVDYNGNLLVDGGDGQEWFKSITLDASGLSGYRQAFPAWADADSFTLSPLIQ